MTTEQVLLVVNGILGLIGAYLLGDMVGERRERARAAEHIQSLEDELDNFDRGTR